MTILSICAIILAVISFILGVYLLQRMYYRQPNIVYAVIIIWEIGAIAGMLALSWILLYVV